ncbi:MAG: DUF6690 family protein [Planctomycetota bacterium]
MLTPLRVAGLIAVAAVGPYVATETEFGRSAVAGVSGLFGDTPANSSNGLAPGITADPVSRQSGYANHAHYEVERLRDGKNSYRYDEELARKLGAIPDDPSQAPTLAGYSVPDLRSVMRFDIQPEWVIGRFHRVTTVLADLNLEGLRVPIVTGIRSDDIAGTLTYYFDHSGKLQRLTIHGFTGDPKRFAETMVQHYGLQREPALEAGAFTKRWNGRPVHFMRLTHAPVVYSDAVHQKYTVFLELNQPNLAYGISAEAQTIVTADHQTGRW